MKFFIPEAKDRNDALGAYDATKKFATGTLGWKMKDRRIQSIKSTILLLCRPSPLRYTCRPKDPIRPTASAPHRSSRKHRG